MIRGDWSTMKKLMVLKGMTGAPPVEDTATGNPLKFTTDLAKPLRSLLIPFTPQQEGTGDPSPSNIRSILPWNGLSVFGSGQNIITNGFTNGVLDLNTGAKSTNPNYITSEYIPVVPLKSYYFKCPTVISSELDICYYDKDKHYIGYADADGYVSCNAPGRSRKTPAGCYYVRIDARNAQYNNDICINYPASVTEYVPAVGITNTDIVFPSPVCGGTLDVVSGVLTVEYAEVILKGTEEWFESENKFFVTSVSALKNNTAKQNIFCDLFKYSLNGADYLLQGQFTDSISSAYNIRIRKHDDAMTLQEFKNLLASNNMHIVYKLETPQEQTLTGHQITAIVGDNTIWSDADGSMTAVYLKKK